MAAVIRLAAASILLAGAVPGSDAVAGFGLDEMARFLEDRGVVVSSSNAVDGAVSGLLHAIDPEGRICTREEADLLLAEWNGSSTNAGAVADFESWPEGVSYLKIRGLVTGGGREIMGHLRALSGGAGVVLDFRGADGMDLESAVLLASPFHEAGASLFRVETAAGMALEERLAGEEAPYGCPVIALIDSDTRNAAELLVALWTGRPGVMLLGEPTRGDLRIREVLPLPDGRSLCLATRRVVLRGGAGTGVRPDVLVEAGNGGATPLVYIPGSGRPLSEKSKQDRSLMMRVDGDPALRRGVDILLALQALQDHGKR